MERTIGPYKVNTIVVGDCLEVLRQIPDGVFQCAVCSPPYWGLRFYGIPPVVWGGDPLCEHEWGMEVPGDPRGGSGPNAKECYGGQDGSTNYARQVPRGQFCQKCGAWLGSLGLEPTPELYVEHIIQVFTEVRRVLRDDGVLWLNMGDSYASIGRSGRKESPGVGAKQEMPPVPRDVVWQTGGGSNFSWTLPGGIKPKDLVGIPWMVAFALRADGWWLRSDIIWAKGVSFLPDYAGSCMPESVRDRPTKSHEYVFLLTKSRRYFYDQDAVREPLAFNRWSMSNKLGSSNRDIKTGQGAPGQSPHSWERKGHSGYFDGEGNPLFNPAGRNLRTVWVINPKPLTTAHFATFPPKLVEPMIKAGTSERGACPECGKAWVRVVGVSGGTIGQSWHDHQGDLQQGQRTDNEAKGGHRYKREFIGWRPACSCYDYLYQTQFPKARNPRKRHQHDLSGSWWGRVKKRPGLPHWQVVPCIVLDPFAGAGTTLMVADGRGCDWLGIDINPDYAVMSRERIKGDRKKRAQLRLF